jgi:hypothetical protein
MASFSVDVASINKNGILAFETSGILEVLICF